MVAEEARTVARLVSLLLEVGNGDPSSLGADEEPYCWFCRVPMTVYSWMPAREHDADCLWACIRRALNLPVPPAAPAGEHWQAEQPYA